MKFSRIILVGFNIGIIGSLISACGPLKEKETYAKIMERENETRATSADPNKTHREPLYPLLAAAREKRFEAEVDRELARFMEDNCLNETLYPAKKGNVKELSENIAKDPYSVSRKGMHGNTPLHCAILGRQYKATKFLLSHGADFNARNDANLTPMELLLSIPKSRAPYGKNIGYCFITGSSNNSSSPSAADGAVTLLSVAVAPLTVPCVALGTAIWDIKDQIDRSKILKLLKKVSTDPEMQKKIITTELNAEDFQKLNTEFEQQRIELEKSYFEELAAINEARLSDLERNFVGHYKQRADSPQEKCIFCEEEFKENEEFFNLSKGKIHSKCAEHLDKFLNTSR